MHISIVFCNCLLFGAAFLCCTHTNFVRLAKCSILQGSMGRKLESRTFLSLGFRVWRILQFWSFRDTLRKIYIFIGSKALGGQYLDEPYLMEGLPGSRTSIFVKLCQNPFHAIWDPGSGRWSRCVAAWCAPWPTCLWASGRFGRLCRVSTHVDSSSGAHSLIRFDCGFLLGVCFSAC